MKKTKKIGNERSVTFCFLYYWTKVTCINPLTLSDSGHLRFSYYSLIYAGLVTSLCSYLWYRLWLDRLEIKYPGETPIVIVVSLLLLSTKYVEAVHTWFMFGFHQYRIKLLVKSFMNSEKTSLKLNIRIDYEKTFKKLAIHLIVFAVAYLSLMIVNNFPETSSELTFDRFLWVCYVFSQMSTITVWITFIWTVSIVNRKFRLLNDKVRLLVQYNYPKIISNEASLESKKNAKYSSIFIDDEIKLIAQLHRELRDVIHRTVEHDAVCILSDVVNQYLCITTSAHTAYRYLKSYTLVSAVDFIYMTAVLFWVVIPVGMLAIISNVCGSTTDEANKTRQILHSVLNDINNFAKNPAAALFNVLSLDLLQNKLRISILGFFDLDHYLVYKAVTTSVTILTIMLQFYN